MSDKLVPQDPEQVMVIRDLVPNVTTFSVPFARFGRIKVGGRATVVRLQTGSLAIFSPVALTPSVRAKLNSISPNPPHTYLIAPDIEHHIFLTPWHNFFPRSHMIAPQGLEEKRASASRTDKNITPIPIDTTFTAENKEKIRVTPEFDAEFEYEYVDAHQNKEIVFFHKPSKTVIEADLMWNLPAKEQYSRTGEDAGSGFATKIFGALMNTKGDAVWQKRMMWYVFSRGDREGWDRSVRRIGGWGFENLVMCHGETLVGDGKKVFEKVFEWHLKGKN